MSKTKPIKPDTVSTRQPKLTPPLPLDDHIEIVSKRLPKYIHSQETKCNSNGTTTVDDVFL